MPLDENAYSDLEQQFREQVIKGPIPWHWSATTCPA